MHSHAEQNIVVVIMHMLFCIYYVAVITISFDFEVSKVVLQHIYGVVDHVVQVLFSKRFFKISYHLANLWPTLQSNLYTLSSMQVHAAFILLIPISAVCLPASALQVVCGDPRLMGNRT